LSKEFILKDLKRKGNMWRVFPMARDKELAPAVPKGVIFWLIF
jgi:hypothetical protein